MNKLIIRTSDKYGNGYFGSPRGARKHLGVDIVMLAGSPVKALRPGRVTKLGYAYASDLSYRYVQVTAPDGVEYRYFYVQPRARVGDEVEVGTLLGLCQNICIRYPGITPHIHFEMRKDGEYQDPTPLIKEINLCVTS